MAGNVEFYENDSTEAEMNDYFDSSHSADDFKEKVYAISGVGRLLKQLRGEHDQQERIVLDAKGRQLKKKHSIKSTVQSSTNSQEKCYLPGGGSYQSVVPDIVVHHNKTVEDLRDLVRSKMVRCKMCKNRFCEVNLMERHMKDKHPKAFKIYMEEQERVNDLLMERERERNHMEELLSGGFIPPENELESTNSSVELEEIPLPGEDANGIVPRFNEFGGFVRPSMYLHKKMPFIKKESPQCPFCDKRFRNQFSFRNHLQKKHEECVDFVQCLECFKCLPDKSHLPQGHHLCDMTFLCLECKPVRNLCTDDRLWRHKNKFHRGAMSGFKCIECNLKFLTPRKLRKHRKMAHVFTRTFQCHFCEELFISETSLTVHERIHTGIVKFECVICDQKTNRFMQMDEHMKDHHGYVCAICQEKCVTWNELKDHILTTHSGYITENSSYSYVDSPRVWLLYKGE